MQRLITSILRKKKHLLGHHRDDLIPWLSVLRRGLFVSQGSWGEVKKSAGAAGTMGSGIAVWFSAEENCSMTFQILFRRCGLCELPKYLWPIYMYNRRIEGCKWLKSPRISVAEGLGRPDTSCQEGHGFDFYSDVRWLRGWTQHHLGMTYRVSHLYDYYLRIQKTISTLNIWCLKKTG